MARNQKILPACHIRILHINDVYELDNLPVLKTAVDALSVGLPAKNTITTLAGDFLAPSLLSTLDHGRGMIDVLNRIPINAVCFGNHEADVPTKSLHQRIAEFKGQWLNSNMRTFKPVLPDNVIFEVEGGRSVALVGLNIGGGKDKSLYKSGALDGHAAKITPVLEAVDDVVKRCRAAHPAADVIIPLTHQSMPEDVALAKKGIFPVILGGHDHEVFMEMHEGVPVLKAGMDAVNLVCVDLRWPANAARDAQPKVEFRLVPLANAKDDTKPRALEYKPDAALAKVCHRWLKPVRELQEATLAKFPPKVLSSVDVRTGPSTMGALLAEALRVGAGAQGTLLNSGSVRGDKVYVSGLVTYADLLVECPFQPAPFVVIKVTGEVLRKTVADSRKPWAEGVSSGMAFQMDPGMTTDAAGLLCTVMGQSLEAETYYNIAVGTYMLRADPNLKAYAEEHRDCIPDEDAGRPTLDLLASYFCDQVWRKLIDVKEDGSLNEAEVDALLDAADVNKDGLLSEEEILSIACKRLPDMCTQVVVHKVLLQLDRDADGKISRSELKNHFLEGRHCREPCTHNLEPIAKRQRQQ